MSNKKHNIFNFNYIKKEKFRYLVVPEKESEWQITQIKWFAIGKCQKQNHRKESRNHVKAGENETRRKLKTKESR
ncbi:hypothetical protein MAL01_08000 [Leptospira noguchii]|uniref:hypothetical protein n=1 Tax=Leptospira noguchii TaxID=28182 RepID=UPI001FB6840D|nr:hypothetical protein [Leptospira noguchii]UOG46495.1 hypothetical protein MAL01_08000 [Leptospira noguchii]